MRRALLVVAILVTSCGGGTDSPTTSTAPTAIVTSLAVIGASSLTVGQTSQFTAMASLSNGTIQEVTNQTSWQSSNPSIATVSASGLMTALTTGSTTITATYQGKSGTADVAVQRPLPLIAGNWKGAYTVAACYAYANLYGTVGPMICGSEFRIASTHAITLSLSQTGSSLTGSLYFNEGQAIAGSVPFNGSVTSDGHVTWDVSVPTTGSYTAANGRIFNVAPGSPFTATTDGSRITITAWAFGFQFPAENISYPPSGWADVRPGMATLTK